MSYAGAVYNNSCSRCKKEWQAYGISGKRGECPGCGSVCRVVRIRANLLVQDKSTCLVIVS